MKKVVTLMALCLVFSSLADIPGKIKLDSLLNSIQKGHYTFKPVISSTVFNKMIDLKREKPNHEAIRTFVAHQRVKYTKWNWDNLYFRLAIIDDYEYRVSFTPETRTCTLAVDKSEKMARYRKCQGRINKCLYSESQEKSPSQSKMKSCFKSSGCTFKPFHQGSTLDTKHCSKIYGRPL